MAHQVVLAWFLLISNFFQKLFPNEQDSNIMDRPFPDQWLNSCSSSMGPMFLPVFHNNKVFQFYSKQRFHSMDQIIILQNSAEILYQQIYFRNYYLVRYTKWTAFNQCFSSGIHFHHWGPNFSLFKNLSEQISPNQQKLYHQVQKNRITFYDRHIETSSIYIRTLQKLTIYLTVS